MTCQTWEVQDFPGSPSLPGSPVVREGRWNQSLKMRVSPTRPSQSACLGPRELVQDQPALLPFSPSRAKAPPVSSGEAPSDPSPHLCQPTLPSASATTTQDRHVGIGPGPAGDGTGDHLLSLPAPGDRQVHLSRWTQIDRP